MEQIKPITAVSYKIITRRPNGSVRVQTVNADPSLTDQSVAQDTDINSIMKNFEKTGQPPRFGKPGRGIYSDVSQAPKSLVEAYEVIKDAEDKFSKLPSNVREKFRNNPQEMINFLQNPQNLDEAVKLGLLQAPPKNDDSNDENKGAKKQAKQKQPVQNDSGGETAE